MSGCWGVTAGSMALYEESYSSNKKSLPIQIMDTVHDKSGQSNVD